VTFGEDGVDARRSVVSTVAVFVFVAWVVVGLVVGWVMGRRGFEPYTWTLLGVVLGPIAVVLAIAWLVRPPSWEPQLLRAGDGGVGGRSDAVDELVAWDGSPEARASVRAVESLVGDRVGRLTFARVVAIDAPPDVVRVAERELEAACEASTIGRSPSTVLLRGQPAVALKDYAHRLGYDVLALGARGVGRSHALLGSVASALVRGAGLPVVMASADADDAGASRQPA
jgi:nucleotide-binding universal stress UspA family protein